MNYGNTVSSGEVLSAGSKVPSGRISGQRARQTVSLRVTKRIVDIIVAVLALVAFLPLFLIVALLVKVTSKGPVLFRQQRLGKNGKPFDCLKFRTMVVDAEQILHQDPALLREFENNFKLQHDPRITCIGHFLRRSSLDELPQFVNVLRGEMSLIGPRPIVPKELTKYHVYGGKLLSVKPGLSGMWQANGRSETTYAERIVMDMEYIDQCSFALDMKLLLLTLVSLFRRRGAY
jgi:lipopolysaccharide/colanic/teichoic acid biosynthesis glycosyltransferase